MLTVLFLLIGYVAFCAWLCWSGGFTVVYWGLVGWLLQKIGMQAITIGRFCFTVRRGMRLSVVGEKHERFHFMNQWRKLGPFMPPTYLTLLAVYGYRKHPFEQAARRAAGQPEL